MDLLLYLRTRDQTCDAKAKYNKKTIIVLKGSQIRLSFANHVRGGKTAKRYRSDPEYVDVNGIVINDCIFNSPSTAAQFVTGSSVNGWEAWHVNKKTSLKDYMNSLQENKLEEEHGTFDS